MKVLLFVVLIFAALCTISLGQDADLPQDPARCDEVPILQSLCRASKPRYYYKSDTNECLKFIYGGCGANGNIFYTQADCEKLCKK